MGTPHTTYQQAPHNPGAAPDTEARAPQGEAEAAFRDSLRKLLRRRDPRLGLVLARARQRGWSTAALAGMLGMVPTTCSKRIERARATLRQAILRGGNVLDPEARDGWVGTDHDATAHARSCVLHSGEGTPQEDYFQRWPSRPGDPGHVVFTLSDVDCECGKLTGRVMRWTVTDDMPQLADPRVPIPTPVRIQTMLDGRRLPEEEIARLRRMQRVASRVNGAMEADHPDRKLSEQFTAELNDLITNQHFTPYYLARVLGITHRAVTGRLERHQLRPSCPSMAGTPSGIYRRRRIGDPPAPDAPARKPREAA